MHIKSITLHGFKSYGAKTTITGFDSQFNAITGLNGCGKSNILDAICFVLCQNAPTQFRVDSMQDLVYKKGAGGISFASVAITFDNRNKQQSPINYGKHDEIIVERRIVLQGKASKYTINGSNATQTQVMDMFRSVQLNIQNPHFLIMQGRIVKVLNYKPDEIWKMVEEAAGTMVYITKRDSTLKMIKEKEKRIADIDALVSQVLEPQITRLAKDRQEHIDVQRLGREVEKLQCEVAVLEAYKHKLHAQETKAQRTTLKEKEKEFNARKEEMAESVKEIEQKIQDLETGDNDQSDELKTLEKAADDLRKKMVSVQSEIDSNRNLIDEENKAVAELRREIEAKEKETTDLNRRQEKTGQELAAAEAKRADLEGNVQKAQQALAVIVTGVGGRDNAEFGWKNQCTAAQQDLADLNRRLNVARGTLQNLKESARKAAEQHTRITGEHQRTMAQIKVLQDELATLRECLVSQQATAAQALNESGTPAADLNALRQKQRGLLNEVSTSEQNIRSFEERTRYLTLPYTQEPQGLDKKKLFGAAAKLFSVKDPERFLVAVDSASGGKKQHFVVEDEFTAKLLLNQGRITRRVTILPLNRLRGSTISPEEVRRMQQKVGQDKVWAAIDLVEYDPKFRIVAEYSLGSTVVCADLETANSIAFDPQFRKSCVTLDGDSVSPDGIVSGGSRVLRENCTMEHVRRLTDAQRACAQQREKLREVEAAIAGAQEQDNEVRKLEADIHQKENQLTALLHKCDTNDELRQLRDAEKTKEDIAAYEKEMEEGAVRKQELEEKIAELKRKLSDKNAQETEKKEAETHERKCKEAVQKQADAVNAILQRQVEGETAMKNNQAAIEDSTTEIADRQQRIEGYGKKITDKERSLKPIEADCIQATKKYKELRQGVAEKSAELQDAQAAKRNLEKETTKLNRECNDVKKELAQTKDVLKGIEDKLNNDLFQQHPWLGEEYEKLGTDQSSYAAIIRDTDYGTCKAKLDRKTAERNEKQRSVGSENNIDFDYINRQFEELKKKSLMCKQDKTQLESIIVNLDQKKQELIELAVTEVNKHFGSIFSALLPNANCKLERDVDENGRQAEALRIRVALGSNSRQPNGWLWKESLSELSGGQRSLVALSLILAMLKMNPAPVYILDEIDAALDLSHTQNVGRMIQKHFRQSQFVVVSLKEGMFNNANIVFRVGFADGVSKVTVTKNRRKSLANGDNQDGGDSDVER